MFVAYTPREEKLLKDLLLVQHRYGLEIDWLEARDLLKVVPDLNPEGLLGGTYSPGDGHLSPSSSSTPTTERPCGRGRSSVSGSG